MRVAPTVAEQQRRSRGFSMLELVVVVCLIALLAAFAADRLMRLRVEAERTGFDSTVGALRSALGIQVAQRVARDRIAELPKLVGANPMDFLSELPENYKGDFYGVDPRLIEEGAWYFDKQDGTLVYRVRYDEFLDTRLEGPARIRLAIVPVYEDRNGNGRFDPATDVLKGLRLNTLDSYKWSDKPLF
jgi:prepilin-type N-terminal cleavage/methylation domain-containing protein